MADPRPQVPPRPARPGPADRPRPARPDPNPLRLLLGFAGLASASALTTAMLPSVLPHAPADVTAADVVEAPQPSVVHVTRVVQLQPGETPPPQAPVVVQPTPTPIVHVVTTTRQSGVR